MTYIQPAKKSLMNMILMWLIAAIVLGSLFLVMIYNKIVNFEYGIAEVKAEIKEIQAENAELQEKIFTFFSADNFLEVIGDNFIQDKNPEYLVTNEETQQLKGLGLR